MPWSLAHADTVWLQNGDRLTGQISVLDDGKLVLDTDYAGQITLDWGKVSHVQSDAPLMVRMPGLPTDYQARLETTPASGTVMLVGDDQTRELRLEALDRIVRPHPFLGDWSLTGALDVSLNAKTASTRTHDAAVAFGLQARHGWWRHGVRLGYARKTQDSVLKTHNYDTSYTLDRFISPKLFWQGRVQHSQDYIEDLTHRTLLGGGPGYQFWDDELGAFSVSGLLAHVQFGYRASGSARFMAAGIGWDYVRYFFGKQLQVFTHGEFYRPVNDAADYNLKAEAGLRYNVTNWASLYAKAGQNRVVGARENISETRYSVGLGLTW